MPYANKEDQKAAAARHYQKNKEVMKERAGKWRKINRAKVRKYVTDLKESQPCTDCNVSYPYYVMEFDHITDDKDKCIAQMVSNGITLSRIQAEIAKCELVCANCHRQRTFDRSKIEAG